MPRINETFVKKQPAPERPNALFYDDDIKGFALRVTRKGAKSFVLNYSIHGVERRLTIGRYPDFSAAAARERARDLRRKIADGIDPLAEKEERQKAPTLKDLWEAYQRDHLPSLSPANQQDQTRAFERDILPKLGRTKLEDITGADIDRLHRALSRDRPVWANRVIAYLRKALSLAVRWEWVERNVASGCGRNSEHPRERFLTKEELARMLDSLERMPNRQAANAIRLLLLTGARRSEVLEATWDEFNLERGIWEKPRGRTKIRRDTRVTLSDAAVDLLREMKSTSTSPHLFPSRAGGPVSDIKKPWEWLRREADLPGLRIHDLRHSFASFLVSEGESLEIIGKLLGHTQHQTTKRYAHLAEDPQRRASGLIGDLITARGTTR